MRRLRSGASAPVIATASRATSTALDRADESPCRVYLERSGH